MPFIIAIVSYILGAIPTAYIVVHYFHGKDIRKEGTGNVGARNAYDITGNTWLGIIIAIVDMLKGYGAVSIAHALLPNDFIAAGIAASLALIGHNFNIFLRGKGGRGLATAAGISLAINPLWLLIWCVMYLTGYYIIRRNIHVGAMTGTLGLALLIYTTPPQLISMMMLIPYTDMNGMPFPTMTQHTILVLFLCFQIFLRHLQPIREVILNWNTDSKE
ncbi:MAG TPA: glycerol-3-phosphate acyltransferase [Candidatus Kapabacteria bacterium]|nr:glycerol-3-phosphate acyltransferase [Candidatus Kapabacteria bacterium]